MNFLKYQNISNRSVNIEVPVTTDPRTNILQSLYNQSNDELWIESWLQQNNVYHPIPKIKINKASNVIGIHEAQNSLKECLKLLEKLNKTHKDLESQVDRMPSTEWKQKTVEIGTIKDQFTRIISKFECGDAIFRLKKSIDKRKKKRANHKKKKEFRRQQMDEKFQAREKLHKSIDQWLANKKEDEEKLKMAEAMQKDADCVLSEVTKKKSDARKQMALIGSLAKLRFIRHHMAVQRGEKLSLEDQNAFNITVLKLKNMWESSLQVYGKEEQGLRLMLEKNATEDTKTAKLSKKRRLLDEWHTVFFGPKQLIPQDHETYWALTAAERDTETFIAIRKSWDTFLVSPTNEMGSKIPVGWVLPEPNEGWAKYLSNT
ncbi:programmed cell death protein 7 [Diabrotica virgifera virgifera]|uniref:Programmed cell death protein 7-like n=1 Tax=Diabrotica virgifera virgifera TaxID=50390 RepID=A0A6P7FW95_DIAVI|nr:programmed cell death protein 7 [Diabrotica virgifera virgifera]